MFPGLIIYARTGTNENQIYYLCLPLCHANFMCDILQQFDLNKFKRKISLSSDHCISYTRKQNVNDSDIVLTIGIPYEYFIQWYDARQDAYIGFIKKISVFRNDIIQVAEIRHKIDGINKNLVLLSEENERLNERCEELWTQIVSSNQKLDSKQKDYDTILDENKALNEYLEKVGIFTNFRNVGKGISELGKKQQRRKLTELKTYVEKSLWFAKTFGLNLKSATFSDAGGSNHSVVYESPSARKRYKDLPEEEKTRIKEILLIVDQFCIGEAAYHEITMTPAGENLPR